MNRWIGILLLSLAAHQASAINHGVASDVSDTNGKSAAIDSERDSSSILETSSEEMAQATPQGEEDEAEATPQSLKEMIASLEKIAIEESPREARRRLEIVKALFDVAGDELSELKKAELAAELNTAEASISEIQARERSQRSGDPNEFGKLGPDGRPLTQTGGEVPKVSLTSLLSSPGQESTDADMEKRIKRLVTAILRFLWVGAKKATVALRSVAGETAGDGKGASASLSAFVAGFFQSSPATPEWTDTASLAATTGRLLGLLMILLFLLCGLWIFIRRLRR